MESRSQKPRSYGTGKSVVHTAQASSGYIDATSKQLQNFTANKVIPWGLHNRGSESSGFLSIQGRRYDTEATSGSPSAPHASELN